MISSLSEIMSYSMGDSHEKVPLRMELEYLKHYVDIQQIRYDHKFEVIWDVDDQALEILIPKMILQPLVENAIYHGIRGEVESEEIIVSVCERETEILFRVEDTGKGMEEAELQALRENVKMLRETTEGYGLKNIYERLQIYYAGRADMTIDSQSDMGTVISIRIPKENVGI